MQYSFERNNPILLSHESVASHISKNKISCDMFLCWLLVSSTLCLRRSKNKTHGYIHCAKKSNSDKYLMGTIPKQEKDPKALSQI
jgi:hypothetical protein